MNIVNKSFGVFPDALLVHERRAEVIASNLANQDTPGYVAKDIDYKSALQDIEDKKLGSKASVFSSEDKINIAMEHVKYRKIMQDSMDFNSVDPHQENSAYAENSMRYMAALEFLNGKIRGIMNAIKGE